MRNIFSAYRGDSFSYVFKLVLQLYTTPPRRIDVLRHCNDVCPLARRYFSKKVLPGFEKRKARLLTDLAKPWKIHIKEFNLVRLQAYSLQLTKNKLLHRYEVKISEAWRVFLLQLETQLFASPYI